jgi:hypothetical protein
MTPGLTGAAVLGQPSSFACSRLPLPVNRQLIARGWGHALVHKHDYQVQVMLRMDT